MASPVIMPRQGQSVESCILTKWYKKKGDAVSVGDLLFSYETDKASFEAESNAEGTLLEIFFNEGDDVPVLTSVCVIGKPGENTDVFKPEISEKPSSLDRIEPEKSTGTSGFLKSESVPVPASPRAKKAASRAFAGYRMANATGPEGRVIERDILKMIDKGEIMTPPAKDEYAGQSVVGTGPGGRIRTIDLEVPVNAEFTDLPVSNIRKIIAKTMYLSVSTSAQLTLNTSFDASDILDFRKKIKENQDKLSIQNITINDIILYTVSRTLLKHPEINSHFLDDKVRQFSHANIGIAIDTERGLMVPVIFNADLMSLAEIAAESKRLGEECRKGTINPDLLKGGTFTVTNLGVLDIESFTPILNPPQTGILGVCSITARMRTENNSPITYPAMGLSLTFDHRALDGMPAAKFLHNLKKNLENFSILQVI